MRGRRQLEAWFVAAACVLSAGCDGFEGITPGRCGNDIVEPDRGEDCDGRATPKGLQCVERGSFACRIYCGDDLLDGETAGADAVTDRDARCPPGWGCGVDDVCREPLNQFKTLGSPFAETAYGFLSGDFDGDKINDLLSIGSTSLHLHFLDQGGTGAPVVEIPNSRGLPAVGDLNGDGLTDLVQNVSIGLGVQRGASSRTLDPVVFPITSYPNADEVRFLPAVLGGGASGEPKTTSFFVVSKTGATWQLEHEGMKLDLTGALVARPAIGRAAPSTLDCDKFALAYAEQPKVEVHAPCNMAGKVVAPFAQPAGFPSTVSLSNGASKPRRVFFQDTDGDGLLDLVITAMDPQQKYELHVALGQASGSYANIAGAVGTTSVLYASVDGEIFAARDLDADGDLDVVTSKGIRIGTGAGTLAPALVETGDVPWSDAVIGDFNGNGVLDVVTAYASAPNLTFYSGVEPSSSGAPPVYNPFQIPTVGGADTLISADFDGDLLLDVAFAEIPRTVAGPEPQVRNLSVAFGQPFTGPEAAVLLGRFPGGIGQLQALSQAELGDDAIAEIGIVARQPVPKPMGPNSLEWTVSVIRGSSNRHLLAPLILSHLGVQSSDPPPLPFYDIPVRSFVGRFAPRDALDKSQDLAVAAFTLSNPPQIGSLRLWQIPVRGEVFASYDSPDKSATPLPIMNIDSSSEASDAIVADLDGDHVDELVVSIATKVGNLSRAELFIVKPTETAWSFEALGTPEPLVLYKSLRAAKIDDDDYMDIAAIQVRLQVENGQSKGFTSTPVVFWGDANGAFSTPVLPPQPAKLCPSKFPMAAKDFQGISLAVLNVGAPLPEDGAEPAAGHREIVTVDRSGTYMISVEQGEPTDAGVPKKLGELRCREELPGGEFVHAGDFTGDGVDDIVIGAAANTYVLQGIARRP